MADQESRAAYLSARKLARRYVSDKGEKGELPVLDDRLHGVEIMGEINLGYHEIPLRKIVGTKTAGRSNSFAGNFMPLLGDDTEFALKWQAVYKSQLQEGIREPIKVYEYINRYYVLEGNKRVSILKYVGAASVFGNIIRLVPERDETNNEISIYYEFLDYDKRLFFDNLWFTRRGNFTRLVQQTEAFCKAHGDVEEPVSEIIAQTHRSFREAYRAADLKPLELTTGDALVEYINVFGYPWRAKPREMQKNIKHIYPQLLVAAGTRSRDTLEISGHGETEERRPLRLKGGKMRVAFAFQGSPDTDLWTRFHYRAVRRVARKYADRITVEERFNVQGDKFSAYQELSELVANKPAVLFSTSPVLSDASLRIALENPEMIVLNCDMPKEGKDLNTYSSKMYDASFLCGVLAGAMSETGIAGYMSAASFQDESQSGQSEQSARTYDMNAFALGMRLVNPRARTLEYVMTGVNDWEEHDLAREVFAANGADVALCLHSPDNPLDRRAFPEVYAQLYQLDRRTGCPLESLAAATFDWEPLYDRIIGDTLSGKSALLESGHIGGNPIHMGWGLSTGIMDVFPFNDVIGVNASRLLRIFRDLIRRGEFNPFQGPIYDDTGALRIEDGYVPTLMEIQGINWYESSIVRVDKGGAR